ncbi:threonine dehydrogenase-like Zn-dependent dehydrogenase [Shimia isoporae]|uniref:Threonine dehydrogenase-like Zn-dependent dehydrogenase n=1 Tax=Shimia isoporae TaxID=647720 RepID=A0A4R1N062_9RHOB|nr:alcohol dehydrogenase catalytic domain-containing protein [Shimia isoporae]TCK99237.1 threonine dehydrogenase-like Zn-dependent dehydrogenase [Shimia isoporae]
MKALVYEGKETLGFRDMPVPVAAAGEALVRVDASGICGSDMHAYLGHDARRPAPLVLGHEAAGVVERDGRRVTINPLVSCGKCAACRAGRENICSAREIISMPPREGAFAQFVSVPESNLVEVPEGVPMQKAAMTEPLAVSWHAAKLAIAALHTGMEKRALVLGGGAIGLAAALALRAQGIEETCIIEPNPVRAAYLRDRCGEKVAADAEGPAPMVVDAVGIAQTRATASEHVEPGGVIAHIGLGDGVGGLDVRRMTLQEVTFIGTYTYTQSEFRETAQALFDGRLGPLDWVEERPLEDGASAFADIRTGVVAAPKVILRPWG